MKYYFEFTSAASIPHIHIYSFPKWKMSEIGFSRLRKVRKPARKTFSDRKKVRFDSGHGWQSIDWNARKIVRNWVRTALVTDVLRGARSLSRRGSATFLLDGNVYFPGGMEEEIGACWREYFFVRESHCSLRIIKHEPEEFPPFQRRTSLFGKVSFWINPKGLWPSKPENIIPIGNLSMIN